MLGLELHYLDKLQHEKACNPHVVIAGPAPYRQASPRDGATPKRLVGVHRGAPIEESREARCAGSYRRERRGSTQRDRLSGRQP